MTEAKMKLIMDDIISKTYIGYKHAEVIKELKTFVWMVETLTKERASCGLKILVSDELMVLLTMTLSVVRTKYRDRHEYQGFVQKYVKNALEKESKYNREKYLFMILGQGESLLGEYGDRFIEYRARIIEYGWIIH